jgi:tryptophan-rich sensory protein
MQPWWWGVITGAALAAAIVPAGIMAADKASSAQLRETGTGSATPSAPPGAVFSVVWTILFLLAGGMLAYQGLTARTATDWSAFAVLALAVVLCWMWSFVYARTRKGATFLILAILLITVVGVVVWGSTKHAQKGILCLPWVPLMVWLVFALMLSVQNATVAAVTGARA